MAKLQQDRLSHSLTIAQLARVKEKADGLASETALLSVSLCFFPDAVWEQK